jgi:Flp pilus assembly protein TadD
MRSRRFGPGLGALLLWVACLGGCRQAGVLPDAGENRSGLNPRQAADVQIAFARSLEKRGESERAAATYLEALKQDPSRADAYTRLAILYDQRGQFHASQEAYQKALAAQPGNPDVYCDMGYSLSLQGRWADAEMNLRQALALAPDHARAHNNLGLVLARAGRENDALAQFHMAGCTASDAHANLAFALTLEGRLPEARRQYESAQVADPSSAAVKKDIQELDALVVRVGSAGRPDALPPALLPGAGIHDEAAGPAHPPAAPCSLNAREGGSQANECRWQPLTSGEPSKSGQADPGK